MMNSFLDYLNVLIPNPKCELNYSKDYELLIATMLSAQATDRSVNQVSAVLFHKYPNLEALSCASVDDVASIIRPIGIINRKASNVISISRSLLLNGGFVPNNRQYLESLPGVGRKTTNLVLSVLYNEPYIAVDTHVARVSVRLGFALSSDSVLEIEKKLNKLIPMNRLGRSHLQMVLFGRYYCKAINPCCGSCGMRNNCKYFSTHS